jgi:hypothetical protein
MKGENYNTNGSDHDKSNIIKPTFDTLMDEGHKAFEAYHDNLKELFLSRYEVTRQGAIIKYTTLIIIRNTEVTPEVRPNPPLFLDDVQSMINSALERQAKCSDELVRRLIEEGDGKNLLILVSTVLLLSLLPSLKPIHKQVAHRRATLQCQTPLFSR